MMMTTSFQNSSHISYDKLPTRAWRRPSFYKRNKNSIKPAQRFQFRSTSPMSMSDKERKTAAANQPHYFFSIRNT